MYTDPYFCSSVSRSFFTCFMDFSFVFFFSLVSRSLWLVFIFFVVIFVFIYIQTYFYWSIFYLCFFMLRMHNSPFCKKCIQIQQHKYCTCHTKHSRHATDFVFFLCAYFANALSFTQHLLVKWSLSSNFSAVWTSPSLSLSFVLIRYFIPFYLLCKCIWQNTKFHIGNTLSWLFSLLLFFYCCRIRCQQTRIHVIERIAVNFYFSYLRFTSFTLFVCVCLLSNTWD